jgi:hypothetical protein
MTIAATCTRCTTATRLPVKHLLVAAVPPLVDDAAANAADDAAVGTVAWICQACADLSIHSIDRSALLALVAAGAPLIGGGRDQSQPAATHPVDHQSPEPPKEPTP